MSAVATNPIEELCCPAESWQIGKIFKDGSKIGHYEVIDIRSNKRYRNEEWSLISTKCGLLFCGTMLFSAIRITCSVVKLPFNVLSIPIEEAVYLVRGKTCLSRCLKNIPTRLITGTLNNIWNIVRIPFYSVALQISALIGVFCPFEGRKYYSNIEKSLNHGVTRKNDLFRLYDKGIYSPVKLALKSLIDTENTYPYYLAYCFQSFGNTKDKNIDKVEINPL